MRRRKLPIGIENFREIREEGHYYVDKTALIERLVTEGKHYFLSRPRRFGKSLLLDTVKELYEGREELFEGLHIHKLWNWRRQFPVVRLNMGVSKCIEPGMLHESLSEQMSGLEERWGVKAVFKTPSGRLRHLIEQLHDRRNERVVLLVDEYDKPILDALERSRELARDNRDLLQGAYSAVKTCDAHLRFSMISGVSKFSKVSLFSGLNNLRDITLSTAYSTICGYTDADLDSVFAAELEGLQREEIRRWYHGYGWLGEERLYNPFDVLLLFAERRFNAWWFETSNPKFLLDVLLRRRVSAFDLNGRWSGEELLSRFDVDDMAPEALLFQTGYLTIVEAREDGERRHYRLGYPNLEVRTSLNETMLGHLTGGTASTLSAEVPLREHLLRQNFRAVENLLRSVFAGVPHDWYRGNRIGEYEGYYKAVLQAYLQAIPEFDVSSEDSSNFGQSDMVLRFGDELYVIECKMTGSRSAAGLSQAKSRGYADKYLGLGHPVHLVSVTFSAEQRNVDAFEWERLSVG